MTRFVAAVLLLLSSAPACSPRAPETPYDLLITGATVINGDGTPAFAADVGVRAGRIASIGNLATAPALRRIDATGLTVAPGFIDIHNHSDYTILSEPKAESMIRQGVTTMVLGESRSAGPRKPEAGDGARPDGVKVDWTTLGGYFVRLERDARRDQRRVLRRRGAGLDVRQRLRPVTRHANRAGRDENAHRPGDGRRRPWTLDFPAHAAFQPCDHRQPD